jgi:DNA-binding PadR family transcriptional regulator
MEAEVLKGHLDGLVLATLADEPMHGYAVIEALKLRSGGRLELPEGTVYPVLHRLEAAGMLASKWLDTGRRRRVYHLTAKGRRELGHKRARWREFASTVEAVLA